MFFVIYLTFYFKLTCVNNPKNAIVACCGIPHWPQPQSSLRNPVHLFPNCWDKMVGPTVFGSRHCKNVGVGMNLGPSVGGTPTKGLIVTPTPTISNCRSQKLLGPTLLPDKREKGLLKESFTFKFYFSNCICIFSRSAVFFSLAETTAPTNHWSKVALYSIFVPICINDYIFSVHRTTKLIGAMEGP